MLLPRCMDNELRSALDYPDYRAGDYDIWQHSSLRFSLTVCGWHIWATLVETLIVA